MDGLTVAVIVIAVLAALVTVVVCDVAGSIARSNGRSYWLFFALGLLLWFPALIAAVLLPDRGDRPAPAGPGRGELAVGAVGGLLGLGGLAAAAWALLSYA